MSRTYEEFFAEEQGKLKEEFDKSNPEYWRKLQSNPRGIERVQQIRKQTEDTIDELKQEHRETRQMRIGAEAVKIFEERTARGNGPKSPAGAEPLSSETILTEASQRIADQEAQEVEAIAQNGEEAIRRSAGISEKQTPDNHKEGPRMSGTEQTHFKAELHKAVDAAQQARTQSRKLFYQERENLIEEARRNGSQEPQKDVSIAQRQILTDIDRQEHKDIHAVFEKYGWERSKRSVAFHEHQETEQHNPAREKLVKHVREFVQNKTGDEEEIRQKDEYHNVDDDPTNLPENDQDHEHD